MSATKEALLLLDAMASTQQQQLLSDSLLVFAPGLLGVFQALTRLYWLFLDPLGLITLPLQRSTIGSSDLRPRSPVYSKSTLEAVHRPLRELPGMLTAHLPPGMVQVLISMAGVAVSGQRALTDLSELPVCSKVLLTQLSS